MLPRVWVRFSIAIESFRQLVFCYNFAINGTKQVLAACYDTITWSRARRQTTRPLVFTLTFRVLDHCLSLTILFHILCCGTFKLRRLTTSHLRGTSQINLPPTFRERSLIFLGFGMELSGAWVLCLVILLLSSYDLIRLQVIPCNRIIHWWRNSLGEPTSRCLCISLQVCER